MRGTPDSVRIVEVVEVRGLRGAGTDGDPFRLVTQFWSKDGEFLAEYDPGFTVDPHSAKSVRE